MTPAHDLVSAEYDQHKAEVIRTVASKLAASGVRSTDPDLEASYNEAWHALFLALADGKEIENRIAFLVTVTHRRALNEVRAMKFSRRADVAALDRVGEELDIDARLDAEIQLRQVREGFRSKLSARELKAATLCHLYGYTRPEAAEAMGVRPKRMEKIMDKASARIGSVIETVRSGEHCAEMSSTVRAFALGLLEPEGETYQLATDHLEHCSACRREVWTERGLAAIGPPLPLAFVLLAGGAGISGGAAGGIALGGGKGAAVAGKAGASLGRKAAWAGGATATVVAVAAIAALAAGAIGGSSGDGTGTGSRASLASSGGSSSAAGGSAGASESIAAPAAAARKAAKRARAKAEAKRRAAARKAEKSRAESEAAAAAAEAAPTTAYVPEPTYVPPPEPVAVAPEPEPVKPNPQPPVRPDPVPVKPVDPKPTTDAGEEFGLR